MTDTTKEFWSREHLEQLFGKERFRKIQICHELQRLHFDPTFPIHETIRFLMDSALAEVDHQLFAAGRAGMFQEGGVKH
jgi:hypothetical protein